MNEVEELTRSRADTYTFWDELGNSRSRPSHCGEGRIKANLSRQILRDFGMGIDDAVNGAFVPVSRHLRLHTNKYHAAVQEALQEAATKEEALSILKLLSDRLRSGMFP